MRKIFGLMLVILGFALWLWPSDIVKLILNYRPILFGRYSQGHFAALLLLTPIIWTIAGFVLSKQAFDKKMLGNILLLISSTLFSIIAVIWLSKLVVSPRYIEEHVGKLEGGASVQWQGIIRHRPPNQHYRYVQKDVPIQFRSYPNAPKGHSPVAIELSSDANGYRNTTVQDQYDIVVVGDSFAVGSRVSDDQAWPALLAQQSQTSIYNLGTSGTDMQNYLGSFIAKGLAYKPKIVALMMYEGNDFKRAPRSEPKKKKKKSFFKGLKDSPVTAGLSRLSRNIFEMSGSTNPVPAYTENFSWMPLALPADNPNYYSFRPLRPLYLNLSVDEFETSAIWQANVLLLNDFIKLAEEYDFELVIIYAASKPHVIMPFVDIPADKLKQFLSYEKNTLPDAKLLKQSLYANMDSIETVVKQYSNKHDIRFISTTKILQEESRAGIQTYYTYDQHWTPEGNKIVADWVFASFQKSNLFNAINATKDQPAGNL